MKKLALFLLAIPCFAMGMSAKLATLKALVFQQNVFTISYLQLDSSFFVLRDNAFKHTHELNVGLDLSKAHYFEAKMRELQANGSSYLQTIKQEIQRSIVSLGDRNTQRPVMENHINLIDKVLSGPDIKKIDDYLAIKTLVQEGKADQATILLDIYKRAYGETDSSAELYAYISTVNNVQEDVHQSEPVSAYKNRDMKLGELPQDQLGQKFSYITHSGERGGAPGQPNYGVNHHFGAVPNIAPNASSTASTHSGSSRSEGSSNSTTDVIKLLDTVRTGTLEQAKSAIKKLYDVYQESLVNTTSDSNNVAHVPYQKSLEILEARGDFTGFVSDFIETSDKRLTGEVLVASTTPSSVASTADLVSTPARPATNISKEVDPKIQATLNELQGEYRDSQEYLQAVGSVLQDMKDQGLLTPTSEIILTPEVIEAIAHGAKHFVKQFKLSENPKEFIESVIKYGVCATFHTMTNGVFLGADKLALIGTQVHAILQTDFGSMNAQQKAEFIAERVADILKMALADQVGRKIIPKTRFGGLSSQTSATSSTREVHEAVTTAGTQLKVHSERDGVLLHETIEKDANTTLSNSRIAESTCDLRHNKNRTFVDIKHPVLEHERSGKALKIDPHHRFDRLVDNFARFAEEFDLMGGDKSLRKLYQIEGSLNGESGIFEWIVDPNKGVTHRFFIKDGTITGRPNIYPKK